MRLFFSLLAIATLAFSQVAAADSSADCSAQAFQQNACTTCQTQTLPSGEGSKVVSDIIFTWKNTGAAQQVIYDKEQSLPQLVLIDTGASFTANPADAATFWKWSPALAWVSYENDKEYLLDAGKQVDTYMSASGSEYLLNTATLPEGAPAALVKSTIIYHDIDANTFEDGPKKEFTACTLYVNGTTPIATVEPQASAVPVAVEPTVAPEITTTNTVVSTEAKTKITSRMTKVATGPAETITVALALMITAAVFVLRRKRV